MSSLTSVDKKIDIISNISIISRNDSKPLERTKYSTIINRNNSQLLQRSESFAIISRNNSQSLDRTNTNTIISTNYSQSLNGTNQSIVQKETKYLLFMPHAGFTNQLIALKCAFNLAYATNRTLVLPPVLPHAPDIPELFAWGYSAAMDPPRAIDSVKTSAIRVADGAKFPSFTSIIDFALLKQHNGEDRVNFVDFPEFMNIFKDKYGPISKSILDQHFFSGNITETQKKMQATTSEKECLQLFEESFGQSEVAVIGSAFKISGKIKGPDFIKFFPPSYELSKVLKRVLTLLSTTYVGIHIRTKDIYIWAPEEIQPGCNNTDLKNAICKVMDDLEAQNVTSNETIYIGSNLPSIKTCFFAHMKNKKYSNVVTLNDLAKQDNKTYHLMKNVQSEKNTTSLIVDQLIFALSKRVILINAMPRGSTFQNVIKSRNSDQKRKELLIFIQNRTS